MRMWWEERRMQILTCSFQAREVHGLFSKIECAVDVSKHDTFPECAVLVRMCRAL
jgi:hypothetical protein